MIRTAVRLVLLAGAAAATALSLRGTLATHVANAVARPASQLAAVTRPLSLPLLTILPKHTTTPENELAPRASLAAATAILPPPVAKAPAAKAPPPAKVSTLPEPKAPTSPKATVITRTELEDAIAHRAGGARVTLVRDQAGKPAGLALHGVAALARFGVQEGDVLVSANGLSLRTPDAALAALGKLETARRVTVVLRRGEGTFAVPLELAP